MPLGGSDRRSSWQPPPNSALGPLAMQPLVSLGRLLTPRLVGPHKARDRRCTGLGRKPPEPRNRRERVGHRLTRKSCCTARESLVSDRKCIRIKHLGHSGAAALNTSVADLPKRACGLACQKREMGRGPCPTWTSGDTNSKLAIQTYIHLCNPTGTRLKQYVVASTKVERR